MFMKEVRCNNIESSYTEEGTRLSSLHMKGVTYNSGVWVMGISSLYTEIGLAKLSNMSQVPQPASGE